MSEVAVQRFFETPIIEATMIEDTVAAVRRAASDDGAVLAALSAIVVQLADQVTTDVSRPAMPRHRWVSQGAIVRLDPREPWPSKSAGAFWTAMAYLGDGTVGNVVVEDPRGAAISAGLPCLTFAEVGQAPATECERIEVRAGGLVMIPSFVRHGIVANQARQAWAVIDLFARRIS